MNLVAYMKEILFIVPHLTHDWIQVSQATLLYTSTGASDLRLLAPESLTRVSWSPTTTLKSFHFDAAPWNERPQNVTN